MSNLSSIEATSKYFVTGSGHESNAVIACEALDRHDWVGQKPEHMLHLADAAVSGSAKEKIAGARVITAIDAATAAIDQASSPAHQAKTLADGAQVLAKAGTYALSHRGSDLDGSLFKAASGIHDILSKPAHEVDLSNSQRIVVAAGLLAMAHHLDGKKPARAVETAQRHFVVASLAAATDPEAKATLRDVARNIRATESTWLYNGSLDFAGQSAKRMLDIVDRPAQGLLRRITNAVAGVFVEFNSEATVNRALAQVAPAMASPVVSTGPVSDGARVRAQAPASRGSASP